MGTGVFELMGHDKHVDALKCGVCGISLETFEVTGRKFSCINVLTITRDALAYQLEQGRFQLIAECAVAP